MQSNRLKLYYNYLGNFDFTDKKLQTSNCLVIVPKLKSLNVRSKLNKNILTENLVLEAFGNQRSLIRKTERTFFKNLFFKSTLRKENLFLFLDICLNTIFLCDNRFLILNNIDIENKLYFYLNNNLINYFNLTSNQFRYSIQFFESYNLPKKFSIWFFV